MNSATRPPLRWLCQALFLATMLSPRLAAQTEGYVTTPDSVRLWYRIVGTGSPVLVIPGELYHRTSFDALAKGRRLMIYDSRGRGRSDTVPPAKVSIERRLIDLETIRRLMKVDSFTMIAWSGIAMDGVAYALRYPGVITRLVLLAPLSPSREPFAAAISAAARARTDTVAQNRLNARVAGGEFVNKQAELCREMERISGPTRFYDPKSARMAPDVCGLPTEWPDRNAAMSQAAMRDIWAVDWRDSLPRLTIPTLVIHGEADTFPLEGSVAWAKAPDARLMIVRRAGHWPHYEQPKETLGAIDRFLKGRWPVQSKRTR